MAWHVLKHVLHAIPLLIGIATLLFAVMHMAPGDAIDRRRATVRQVAPQYA